MDRFLNYVLDTDFVSQPSKKAANPTVERWLTVTPVENTYLSVVSLQEIQTGIDLLPDGRRRRDLEGWFETAILKEFGARMIGVDRAIALECGHLLARTKRGGHTAELSDALIAATAITRGFTVVTLNYKDFERLGCKIAKLQPM